MSEKLRVGILGGTGMVGQRFISLLENHPWFEVVTIAASPRSAGKTYEEAVGGRWKMTTPMPEAVKNIVVMNVNEVEKVAAEVDFVFSAVDMTKEEIKKIEEDYAKTETPVVSNNSAHRWTPDVPMVVPEINPDHMKVIDFQKKRLGTTRGFDLGVADLTEAKLEYFENYDPKEGAPNDRKLNRYIWGIYNLLEETGTIKAKTEKTVSRKQAKFIEDFLMAIHLIDMESNLDANNIRSRLNHLIKKHSSIEKFTKDLHYKRSPNNEDGERLF